MPTVAQERAEIRAALLAILRKEAKQTSFSRLLTRSLYDIAAQNKTEAKKAKEKADEAAGEAASAKTKATTKIKGGSTGNLNVFSPNGFYHAATLDFALGRPPSVENNYGNSPSPAYTDEETENWGLGFGNPLVNPKQDCIYTVRARIDQLRADPMVGGFKLEWSWPNGWTPVDGVPRRQLVECSSNPLYVARVFLSPSTTIESGGVFRCRIRAWYP